LYQGEGQTPGEKQNQRSLANLPHTISILLIEEALGTDMINTTANRQAFTEFDGRSINEGVLSYAIQA